MLPKTEVVRFVRGIRPRVTRLDIAGARGRTLATIKEQAGILLGLVIALTTISINAATIRVPQDQPTIQGGINAAVDGDTVLVGPGTYFGGFAIDTKSIALISLSGRLFTFLNSSDSVLEVSNSNSNTSIEGFTIQGAVNAGIIVANSDSVKIESCRFENIANYAIRTYDSRIIVSSSEFFLGGKAVSGIRTSFLITRNVMSSSTAQPNVEVGGGSIDLLNNTFYNCWSGVSYQGAAGGLIANNVFANIGYYSIHNDNCISPITWNYNDFFSVDTVFVGVCGSPGVGNIFEDPLFVDPDQNNFTLRTDSPCRDAGDPSSQYNDPDGTRNDIGAYYFINSPPAAFSLLSPADLLSPPIESLVPQFSWSASSDLDPLDQVSYTLYLAIDHNFLFVNTTPGLTSTSHTISDSLNWGTRYWWKVKASDLNGGETFSSQVFSFRTVTLGDADGNGVVDISDAVFLISYIFLGGPAPVPLFAGDADCSGTVDISDAVYLIGYIFGGGPAPCDEF